MKNKEYILITGSTGKLGKTICEVFAEMGENIILHYYNSDKKIKIITTNSKNNVIFGSNEFIKKIKPPSIKVVNENGAGDALAAMMLYLFSINEKMNYILKTSVACGSYYASGKSLKTKSDFLKIKNLSKKVSVQYYA